MTHLKSLSLVATLVLAGVSFQTQAQTSATCYFDTIKASTTAEQYFDNGDGTVLDVHTGLVWSTCLYGQTYNSDTQACDGSPVALDSFSAAIASQQDFANSAFAGHQDWRLPNIKELATLVEYACVEPAMRNDIFASAPSAPIWSNTPNSQGVGPFAARVIHFMDGTEIVDDTSTTPVYARFVRIDVNE